MQAQVFEKKNSILQLNINGQFQLLVRLALHVLCSIRIGTDLRYCFNAALKATRIDFLPLFWPANVLHGSGQLLLPFLDYSLL